MPLDRSRPTRVRERPLLTNAEHAAIECTGRLVGLMHTIIGDGPTREDDLREFVSHVHVIQRMIMSQAAARAYPDRCRLLGEVGIWEVPT